MLPNKCIGVSIALEVLDLSTKNLKGLDSVIFTFDLIGANTVPTVIVSWFCLFVYAYMYIYNQLLLYSFPPLVINMTNGSQYMQRN